jgi:hypothetical protein
MLFEAVTFRPQTDIADEPMDQRVMEVKNKICSVYHECFAEETKPSVDWKLKCEM